MRMQARGTRIAQERSLRSRRQSTPAPRPCAIAGLAALASVLPLAGCATGDSSLGQPAPAASTAPPPRQIELFDGRSLAGWTAFLPGGDPSATWTVADGALRCTGQPAGYIATDASYASFVLELEWRFDPAKGAGNSGVLVRVQQPDAVWPTSMEAQLMSGHAGDIWNIGDFPMVTDPSRTSGRHTAMEGQSSERPLGEWNRYRIVADGPVLELYVNGALKNRATGCRVVPGRIALQSEGAWIEFRNIRITPLPDRG